MGAIDLLKLGLRSVGDDAARAAFANEAAQSIKAAHISNAVTGGMSAAELAGQYPSIVQNANNFVSDFNKAYTPPQYQGTDALAYGTGRKIGVVRDAAGNMVDGMGGIGGLAMNAAFIAPMFMGNGQQQSDSSQLTPDQIRQLQQQQQQGY